MKKSIALYLTLFCFGFLGAQSVNLDEITVNGALVDSRNGALDFGDIDNDGDQDLMIIGKDGTTRKSTLYTNDGNGVFTEVIGTPFVGLEFGTVNFVDVDNDNDQDLMITGINGSSQQFSNLYLNNGSGTFSLAIGTPFEPLGEGDVDFGDVDGDGDQDVFMTGYKRDVFNNPLPHTSMYINNGSGGFTLATGTPFEQLTGGSSAFIDMDGDNDLDIILAGEKSDGTLITLLYSNNGTGIFTLVPGTTFAGFNSGDIAVADTDGDGDEDIHLVGSTGGIARVSNLYLNNGTGTFSLLAGTPFVASSLGTSDFADFDNDGDFDLLITGSVGGAAFTSNIYENLGSNNFTLTDSLEDAYLTSTGIADIDGDGDLDLAIAGISNGGIGGLFATRIYQNSPILLPVDLLSFEVGTLNKSAQIFWETGTEINNDYFSLEHSRDGYSFREINQQNGQGSTSRSYSYEYLHEGLENGTHYYRLKQVNFEGDFEYSKVVAAKINTESSLEIAPNPTTGILTIQSVGSIEKNARLEVINMQGQVLSVWEFDGVQSNLTIDISDVPPGVYYLRITQGSLMTARKIIKK